MSAEQGTLRRVVHIPGAILLGLGSILGTGVFVSIGLAAGVVGSWVLLAVPLAALIATFNGLSSAQLAANYPVSGGTYEYGYRTLNPWLGFAAGWMFLAAKSASAATALLGLAGYLLNLAGVSKGLLRTGLGLATLLVLTLVVAGGIKRSNTVNAIVVATTLLTLLVFVSVGVPALDPAHLRLERAGGEGSGLPGLLHATALMFVAYTGYGRVATLGEEIEDPARNVPRAIVATLIASALIYVGVTVVAVGVVGPGTLADAARLTAAPLHEVAAAMDAPWLAIALSVAALTAMAGVVLNLLLGLSRVVLAMARRGDLPARLAHVREDGSPVAAVIAVAVVVGAMAASGRVETTWPFSAFTVLVYYGITNLAALQLTGEQRRFPRLVPLLGLLSCLGVAFFVEPAAWVAGLSVLAFGLVARLIATRVGHDPR